MLALFKKIHLFNGLSEHELDMIANNCQEMVFPEGKVIVRQNSTGDEIYFVANGVIEVYVESAQDKRMLVMLGEGQVFGEMALIGQGYRSASGRAGKDGCKTFVLKADVFNKLCDDNKNIGYVVMRNMALDLAFKLRHRNLTGK